MSDIMPTTDPWRPAPHGEASDVIFGELAPPVRPRGRRAIALVLTVFTLIAGGGLYALSQLSGGGAQPESRAPASTFAFVKVDLDPALGQKLAFRDFASKFPSAPASDAEDILDAFLADALRTEDIDYEHDVKPWFAKRIALAGFLDAAGAPQALGIIKVTDEVSARAGLEKLAAMDGSQFAFRVDDEFAVIADSHAIADAAISAADKGSLGDRAEYRSDVAALGGDQVVTAWVDLAQVAAMARQTVEVLPPSFDAQLRGRAVAGLHFAGDYVEVTGLALDGAGGDQLVAASPSLLTSLPASTVGAVAVNGLDAQVGRLYADLATAGFGTDEMLGFVEEETGLRVIDDLLPVLGRRTVVALGAVPDDPLKPRIALVSEVADPERARSAGERIAAAARAFDIPVDSEVRGSTFYLASGPGYLAELTRDGALGDDPMFKKAMGDLGDEITGALYVDLRPIVAAFGDGDPNLAALGAVGMSGGTNADGDYFRLRVVVN